ncbi:MAG: hypothetical protein Q9192_001208 [Flavoplaca navasiana]
MEGIDTEMRWKNMLKPNELPWVRGHQLQHQTVLPAAAYVSTAIEASEALASDLPIGLIEVCDFVNGKPLAFEDDDSGVETLFSLTDISRNGMDTVLATFTYYACTSQASHSLTRLASGRLLVRFGEPSSDWLSPPSVDLPNMVRVDEKQFYASVDDLGYGYSGDFRTLESMNRKLNFGSAKVSVPEERESPDRSMLVHPAMLDAAFQAIFLAYSVIKGDVDISDSDKQASVIQVEGVKVVAFAEGSPQYDRQLFSEHIWDVAFPDGELAMTSDRATGEDYELARALERASLFYLKKLDSEIPLEARQNLLEWNHEALFDFASFVLSRFRAGKQHFAQQEWLDDSWEQMDAVMANYPDSIEMKLTRTVGENLPRAVRGETNMLQHLFADNLLNTYYIDAMGLKEFTEFLSKVVTQIAPAPERADLSDVGTHIGRGEDSDQIFMKRFAVQFAVHWHLSRVSSLMA